jgi:acetoin utilization deacetylase AcuC-like enzyme
MGPYHPERPERLQAIEDQLISSRISNYLEFREAPLAEVEDISRIHLPDTIAMVRDNVPDKLGRYYAVDADTHLNMYTWQAALRAAGAAVAATDAVIAGEIDNAFCLVRPVGHHATASSPMGFCIFNNVAIAAMRAMAVHGLERVAIIDFDVHHGNGTEESFADDSRVLMASFFQNPFYPYSGTENKSRHMVNVPVPAGTAGDKVRQLVTEQWLPALHAHRPEMIFISAGFDAHREDSVGGMELVEDDFAWMTQQLMEVARQHAKGRIVSFLEGGYSLSATARSAVAHIKALAELD